MKHFIITLFCLFGLTQLAFTQTTGTFTDKRDNKTYQTVSLSAIVWMAENLNYASKNSWCNNCEEYGRHYTYEDALTVCPEGWHLATYNDWKKLYLSLDLGAQDIKTKTGWEGDGNGNNDYNFSAKPAGKRTPDGHVEMQGSYGFWWTSEEKDEKKAQYWYLGSDIGYLSFDSVDKSFALSVRCVKNQ